MANPGSIADENEIPTLAAGTILGKYSIVKLLGSGGMGAVYEATHTEIGKRVAIKVLSPLIAAVPGARARFLREAQLTSRVRHPHIVDVADMGSDGGHTYLVMEFLHGEDLAQRIERLGPVGVEELADIMLPVCSAVAAAHAAGITHRDLKPQNIFLAAGTRRVLPKVLDFGISKGNDAVTQAGTLTGTGAMIGTPYYLAPEQIMDSKSAGSASDQYALGIILYECLTGKRPYDGENLFVVFQGIVGGTPKRLREMRPEIPLEMEEVVLRAMKVDPKARFATIEDFGRALLPFASGRSRVIWEEAFSGGAAGELPPGRPSIAMFPTPTPPPRAATLMPPGLSNPGAIPGAMTPKPPGAVTLSTSQRIGAGTPTPPPKTIAWQSPMPQSRVPPGGTAVMPSPETEAAATVRASVAMSKSHPVVIDNGLDFETAPEPARSKKGIVIGVVAAVAAAGIGFFVLSGGSKEATVTPAPVAVPAAAPPAAPRAPAAVVPDPPAEAPKPAAVAPPEAKPAPEAAAAKVPAPSAEAPPSAAHESKSHGKGSGKSKPHGHTKESAAKPAAAKPAAGKPAAAGVPVID